MPEDAIDLVYDPFTLPTAQHRAGLAGLIVLIESMRRRRIEPLPGVSTSSDGKVLIALTKESFGAVFKDLYDAATEEVTSNRKRGDSKIPPLREEKRVDSKTGKEKTVYVYPQVIPKAAFLRAFMMPDVWVKLWREAFWATLRSVPKTRTPYQQMARDETPGEVDATWKDLKKFELKQEKNEVHTVEIAGSIFIGAQAWNADRVPFRSKADEAFLLHFWPVVTGVYVPQVMDRDGKTKSVGYVLAVPDVSDLESFVRDFPDSLAQFGNEVAGYRPKDALISIPEEGGLEYLRHLRALTQARATAGELAYSISGVDVYHLKPPDRSRGERMVRMVGTGRVAATRGLLEKYESIRRYYYNPSFRGQVILNLLRGSPWYRRFDRIFAEMEHKRFVGPETRYFSSDVNRCFSALKTGGEHDR